MNFQFAVFAARIILCTILGTVSSFVKKYAQHQNLISIRRQACRAINWQEIRQNAFPAAATQLTGRRLETLRGCYGTDDA